MAPHAPPHDDDLFEPVLTAEHELSGVDRPYRLNSLLLVAFFAGPLFGGFLIARNFVRLGQPERFAPWFGIFAATWLVTFLLSSVLANDAVARRDGLRSADGTGTATTTPTEPGDPADGATADERSRDRAVRFLIRLAGLIPAFAATRLQRRRFENYELAGKDPASLWLPGIVAFLASLAFHTAASFALAVVLVFLAGS